MTFRVSILLLFAAVLSVIVAVGFVLPLSGQAPPLGIHPGDPVSDADEVFVSLDASSHATCGVTAANNIRCWGQNRYAPLWADGFIDVATGTTFSCGLKLDRTVQCWGVNRWGANMLTPPTDDGAPIKFKSIDSRRSHTCAIRDDNDRLHCWGYDGDGETTGSSTDSSDVSYDFSSDSFTKISVGESHTCGLIVQSPGDTGTNVRCWGEIRIGNDSAGVPSTYSSTVFKEIDSGFRFNCGIIDGGDDDGKAVCWGTASYGIVQTPIGTTGQDLQISEPSADRFIKISSGDYHVCGIKTDNTMACWGATKASGIRQAYGQADVPSEHRSSTFSDVVSARYHTCAILDGQNEQVEGDIVCWGAEIPYNPYNPQLVPDGRIFDPDHPYPPPHRFPQVSSGTYFNCGISADRDLVCWGGSTSSPGIVEGPFETLDMGERHVCAVRANGRVNCYGFNNNLQGAGSSPGQPPGSPLYRVSSVVEDLTTHYTFKSVSASFFHTCGILDGRTAEQTDGEAICWGHNSNRQATPPDGLTFSSITTGWYHSCGLLDDQNEQVAGTVVCWGAENDVDGNGNVVRTIYNFDVRADFGQADVPAELDGVPLSSISARRYHTCGIRSDNGRMTCWGSADVAAIPEEFVEQSFSAVAVGEVTTCGITSEKLAKCWGWSGAPTVVEQFRIPTDYAETRFVVISSGRDHACATKENGKVICWGADADVSTPQLEIYRPHSTVPGAFTIINTRQAWVPREFRASPINPLPTPTPSPTATPSPVVTPRPTATPRPAASIKILRIEPGIRGVSLRTGKQVRLDVEVYGRHGGRDDSLGDLPEITFEWVAEDFQQQPGQSNGDFSDDRRVLHTAPTVPGRYRVRATLDIGTECLPAREGETAQDAVDRCTAVFEVIVTEYPTPEPTPDPPVDPPGEVPDVIVDNGGRNYEVFKPEGGGEIVDGPCSFKLPRGAVPNHEVIGVSVWVLEEMEDQLPVIDHRFMTDGVQCRIQAANQEGALLSSDYHLRRPGEVCMSLPESFTGKAVETLTGAINEDSTLTRLSSKLYLASPDGRLKVCGNLMVLSATTVVALPGEVSDDLPPASAPTPESPDTGGSRLSEANWMMAMIFGVAMVVAVAALVGRRRKGMG